MNWRFPREILYLEPRLPRNLEAILMVGVQEIVGIDTQRPIPCAFDLKNLERG